MPDLDALYAAVYAAPDDDQPRRALAEALVAQSDPYGEFIQLQLDAQGAAKQTRQAKQRMASLLKAHATEWLQPLGGTLAAKTVKWERGFPVAGRLKTGLQGGKDSYTGSPGLCTLRELDVEGGDTMHDERWLFQFLTDSPLRNLRALNGLPRAGFPLLLAADPPWALETLTVVPKQGGGPAGAEAQKQELVDTLGWIERQVGLPHLKHLSIGYHHQPRPEAAFGWLFTTSFGKRLRSLQTRDELMFIKRWLTFIEQQPFLESELESLGFGPLTLTRTDRGWTRLDGGELHVQPGLGAEHTREWLAELTTLGLDVNVTLDVSERPIGRRGRRPSR